jgi:predicted N-acetyltransferase YhbS
MEKVRIRLARPGEARTLAAIEESAARKFIGWPGFETLDLSFLPRPAAFEPFVAEDSAFIAEDDSGHALGFVALTLMDGEPYIAELDVALEHQGHGIGRALIACACAWAREQGANSVILSTNTEVPWNAPWYERLGFTPVPRSDYVRPGIRAQRGKEAPHNDMTKRIFMRKVL